MENRELSRCHCSKLCMLRMKVFLEKGARGLDILEVGREQVRDIAFHVMLTWMRVVR